MRQKDSFKVEVWLDNSFYNKLAVNRDSYNVGLLVQEIRTMMQQGLVPTVNKIEIRRSQL